MTIANVAKMCGISASTVKRRLAKVPERWRQPTIQGGSGFVHIDATYYSQKEGLLVALEANSGRLLYAKQIGPERAADYTEAIEDVRARGYDVKGLILDGNKGVFGAFPDLSRQMCLVHMKRIIRRYLTGHPKAEAACELLEITGGLCHVDGEAFRSMITGWEVKWSEFLKERTQNCSGGSHYTHKRLRSAIRSLRWFMPYLSSHESQDGMPATNNRIEGFFSNLKSVLGRHRGMNKEHRWRLIVELLDRQASPAV